MRAVAFVTRVYSYLFHLALACAMMALAVVAWTTGVPLNITVLPWQGATLTSVLFFSGLAGAAFTVLAIKRILPFLFILWTVVVAIMIVYGFFFGSYVFGPTSTSFNTAALFSLAAIVAAGGSVSARRAAEPAKRWAAMA